MPSAMRVPWSLPAPGAVPWRPSSSPPRSALSRAPSRRGRRRRAPDRPRAAEAARRRRDIALAMETAKQTVGARAAGHRRAVVTVRRSVVDHTRHVGQSPSPAAHTARAADRRADRRSAACSRRAAAAIDAALRTEGRPFRAANRAPRKPNKARNRRGSGRWRCAGRADPRGAPRAALGRRIFGAVFARNGRARGVSCVVPPTRAFAECLLVNKRMVLDVDIAR